MIGINMLKNLLNHSNVIFIHSKISTGDFYADKQIISNNLYHNGQREGYGKRADGAF